MSDVERRVAELEHRLTFAGFHRIYGALAPVLVALAFLPVYPDLTMADLEPNDPSADQTRMVSEFGSLWQMIVRNDDLGWLGIPVLVLVVLLAVAAFRIRSARLPAAIAAFAAVTALLLLSKPVTGTKPPMAEGGMAMVGVLCCVAALGVGHVITLYVRQRPPD